MTTMMSPDCRDGKCGPSCAGGWDMETDQPAPCPCACHQSQPEDCSGADECDAAWHFHGCLADVGACERPEEHTIAAETPRQRLIGK